MGRRARLEAEEHIRKPKSSPQSAGLWSGSDGVARAKTSAAHRQHLNALYTGDELFAEAHSVAANDSWRSTSSSGSNARSSYDRNDLEAETKAAKLVQDANEELEKLHKDRASQWQAEQQAQDQARGNKLRDRQRQIIDSQESFFAASSENLQTSLIKAQDVPFLCVDEVKFISEAIGSKKSFQQLALRWHPDKFMAKFGAHLDPNERDLIVSSVQET